VNATDEKEGSSIYRSSNIFLPTKELAKYVRPIMINILPFLSKDRKTKYDNKIRINT